MDCVAGYVLVTTGFPGDTLSEKTEVVDLLYGSEPTCQKYPDIPGYIQSASGGLLTNPDPNQEDHIFVCGGFLTYGKATN